MHKKLDELVAFTNCVLHCSVQSEFMSRLDISDFDHFSFSLLPDSV